MLRKIEESLVRKVTACISASITEAKEIENLGCKIVRYFPPTFEPITFSKTIDEPLIPKIVHLGGMRTTATRQGLERFLDIVWPKCRLIVKSPLLYVIGDLTGASNSILAKLKKFNAYCTGFVEDLSHILKPYDIFIIPWEYNSRISE